MTQTQQQGIKAIETVYNGYRFRSRLEARWAVFFDTLGIRYEYEKEGFDLGEAGWYLPDFWLPEFEAWVEIKGQQATEDEEAKASDLAKLSAHDVLILCGDIPRSEGDANGGGPAYNLMFFKGGGGCDVQYTFTECAVGCGRINIAYPNGDRSKCNCSKWHTDDCWSPRLQQAYTAARQARFEHGETPRTTRSQRTIKPSNTLALESEMQRRSAEAIEMLRDYVANFDERWDAHAKETAERWPDHARKYCTSENKAKDRRAAEYRIRKYDLNIRMAALDDRQRVLEAQGDRDALRAALMERQALVVEMRDLHTEFCSLFSPKTKSRRTPTVNKS